MAADPGLHLQESGDVGAAEGPQRLRGLWVKPGRRPGVQGGIPGATRSQACSTGGQG